MSILRLIIIHLFFVSLRATTVKSCHDDERASLLAFKAAFAIGGVSTDCGQPYAKTESWRNGNMNCCRWDGVTCDPSSSHVTELDLSCSLLTGGFPSNSTLFSLRGVRRINLAYNNFSSSIPSGFGRLSHLTYLNLSHSGFSGQVPQEIGWLFRLTSLDLSYAEVEMLNFNTIIANMSNLRELDLSNVLYSNVSPMVANLSDLESLRLSGCHLVGEFPAASVLDMLKLRVLDVRDNIYVERMKDVKRPKESHIENMKDQAIVYKLVGYSYRQLVLGWNPARLMC